MSIYINNIATQSYCQRHIQPMHATLDYIHAHRICMLWIKPPRYVRMHTTSSCTISASSPYPHTRYIHMRTIWAHAHIHMHPHTFQRVAQRVALMIVSSTLNAKISTNTYECKKKMNSGLARARVPYIENSCHIAMDSKYTSTSSEMLQINHITSAVAFKLKQNAFLDTLIQTFLF